MRVGHTDSTGKRWVFNVPCQPLQANMFARFLRHVRNLGKAETRGHLRPTDYVKDVERLSREVEQTVLAALSERYPDTDGNTTGEKPFIL